MIRMSNLGGDGKPDKRTCPICKGYYIHGQLPYHNHSKKHKQALQKRSQMAIN